MKQLPIVFKLGLEEGQGFTPFRNDETEWIYKRDVIAVPFTWNSGSGIVFTIKEYYSVNRPIIGLLERDICTATFFDHQHPELKIDLDNLASGDLRGRGAEHTCHHLFWKLFLFSDEMREYLPKYVKDIEKIFKEK